MSDAGLSEALSSTLRLDGSPGATVSAPLRLDATRDSTLGEFVSATLRQPILTGRAFTWLPAVGRRMKLRCREATLQATLAEFAAYVARAVTKTLVANDCKVEVYAGAPGVGKSRLVAELEERVLGEGAQFVALSYNQGENPTLFDRSHPEAGLVLRIVHGGWYWKELGFPDFLGEMRHRYGDELDALSLPDLLAQMKEVSDQPLVLAVDEFNYLLDSTRPSTQERRSLLTAVVRVLGNAMLSKKKPFFPVLSGTAAQPVAEIIAGSAFPYRLAHIPLLSTEDVAEILNSMPEFEGWATSREFCRALSALGGLPRVVEFFLTQCADHIAANARAATIPVGRVLASVRSVISARYLNTEIVVQNSHVVLVDALLERRVRRAELLPSGRAYGELEEVGGLVLENCVDAPRSSSQRDSVEAVVKLPLVFLSVIVGDAGFLRAMPNNLRAQLRDLIPEWSDKPMRWQAFEEICARFLAVRCGLLHYSARNYPTASGRDALDLASYPPITLKLGDVLRGAPPNALLETRIAVGPKGFREKHTAFPPSDGVLEPGPRDVDHVVWAGGVGAADGYTYFLLEDENDEGDEDVDGSRKPRHLLVMLQCKKYDATELNADDVTEECAKVKRVIGERAAHYALVLCSNRRVSCGASPECLLLCDEHLRSFFGVALSELCNMYIEGPERVNVNTASEECLARLPGIHATLAQRIVENKPLNGYADWGDLKARVKYLREASRGCLKYKDF